MDEEFPGSIGILFADLHLPECHSLKMKRGILQRIQQRIRAQYNVSVSELEYQDKWQRSLLGFAIICSDSAILEHQLQNIALWLQENYPEQTLRTTVNII
ncbi:MAG: DUF503 domain-containing protein [Bdellovibrionales bacterium]|nr:DUF503 domain-containing protein [Bdellovibrionales bacterium]